MRTILVVVAVALSVAIAGIITFGGQPANVAQSGDDTIPPTRTILIGSLHPLTGSLSTLGVETIHATELAVHDFNQYLEEQGEDWRMSLISEDTATTPAVALDKLQTLHSRGIDIVIGPVTSANIQNTKGYADANDIIMFSCCSSSSALAIPDDNIFRISLDNKKHGVAMGKIIRDNADVLIPVWRADSYGQSFRDDTLENFVARGGVADPGISYNPDTHDFSAEISLLNEKVEILVDQYGPDRVGILLVAFEDAILVFQAASQYDILHEVRWFGSQSLSKSQVLAEDPVSGKFVEEVGFLSTDVAANKGPKFDMVADYVAEKTGDTPSSFMHGNYDSVWMVGLTMLDAGATDAMSVKSRIPDISAQYQGALGNLRLNDAGDLDVDNLSIVSLMNGTWVDVGIYDAINDDIIGMPDP